MYLYYTSILFLIVSNMFMLYLYWQKEILNQHKNDDIYYR